MDGERGSSERCLKWGGGGSLRDLSKNILTLSGPGFEKLAQTGGADSAPLLTSLPCIRTKPNLVWANTII